MGVGPTWERKKSGSGRARAAGPGNPNRGFFSEIRFPNRKVTKVNEKARALGIHEGMEAIEALALIA